METNRRFAKGRYYYHGIGVEADRIVARVWFDRAAEIGITD